MSSKKKLRDSKIKIQNWCSIMIYLNKIIKSWKKNFKVNKNQLERNFPREKYGKMYTIT